MAITWTVIGVYDTTGEVWAEHFEATGAHGAMASAAQRAARNGYGDDMMIVGAVPGAHTVVPPSEDSGKASYAVDLLPQD